MGGICGAYGGFGGPNLTKRDQLELTDLLGKIIFKKMVRKQNGIHWAGQDEAGNSYRGNEPSGPTTAVIV